MEHDNIVKIKESMLKTTPSLFWKIMVDIFLSTITSEEQRNFKLASSKFAASEPHLFVKDVPWFKEWYKTNKEKYVIID
jgi:hypothetical protein